MLLRNIAILEAKSEVFVISYSRNKYNPDSDILITIIFPVQNLFRRFIFS